MPSLCAMQNGVGAQADQAVQFLKAVLNFDYMNGENGEYRQNSTFEKIVNQPSRALVTAALYLGAAWAGKKVFDFASKHGVFQDMARPARAARPNQTRRPQNRRPVQHLQQRRPQNRPHNNQRPAQRPHAQRRPNRRPNQRPAVRPQQNRPVQAQRPQQNQQRPAQQQARGVRIAAPINGRQLNVIPQLAQLNGFYHMQSQTPFNGYRESCGFHALYNMAMIEAENNGQRVNNGAFQQALGNIAADGRIRMQGQNGNNRLTLRDILGRRGMSNTEAVRLARALHLSPVTVLANPRTGALRGRLAELQRANGPHAVHFLCNIPGHWVEISVVKNARGEQAMYLYDNLNTRPRSAQMVQQYVEAIYNAFF